MRKDLQIQPFKYVDAVILPGKLAVPVEAKTVKSAAHKQGKDDSKA